ncbi:MAG: alanine--tRNA ligase [Armatimonadota bacterium]|jgi:alanyl-tRNA synthetase
MTPTEPTYSYLYEKQKPARMSRELRKSFLDYFAQHDHHMLPSSPLKPSDETTLFTSAGMQQFVPWYRGIVPAAYPRVVTCQKCFRSDDIDEVGLTPWHCTFFEMLGNFSFGDYFKEGAIEFGWEFVTSVLKLPKSRIWITVHPEDDESPGIWKRVAGIPDDRMLTDPTNWWGPVGNSGPCGPDTEIHLDSGPEVGCGRPDCNPTCSCSRFNELWNLVFQTYNKLEDGKLERLPKPGIDTGLGFERMVALIQDVPSIFETDLLAPIVAAVFARARSANPSLPERLTDRQVQAARIITDHTRAVSFLLADGFTPSNDGAGYVVRRVLRRAYRFGRTLGIEEPFLHRLVPIVAATMGPIYPELKQWQQRIMTWVQQEEKQFEETLGRAWPYLMDAIEKAKATGASEIDAEEAFKLYDTYGLPREIIEETAAEHGLEFSRFGFEVHLSNQRALSGAANMFDFVRTLGYENGVGKTTFVGYDALEAGCRIVEIVRRAMPRGVENTGGGPAMRPVDSVQSLAAGERGEVFLDRTPFYARSGGQVGDHGVLRADGAAADVLDTYSPVEGAHAHEVKVTQGALHVGQQVQAEVDRPRRQALARAHTATHLLHFVLRDVLGEHALQSGSLVEADRLRFDFAHFSALTPDQRQRIEDGVARLALQDEPLVVREMPLEQARAEGAVALFGEKYGETVRLVQIGDFSKELCGGTHLDRSSGVGAFAITSEGSIGSNLRRIEAVTGMEAQALLARQREQLSHAAASLGTSPEKLSERLEALHAELRRAQREIARLQQKSAGALAEDLVKAAVELDGVKLIAERVALPADALRGLADDLVKRLGSGIVVLGCESEGRAQFVSEVSKDLIAAGFHAGNLIREVAKIAGGGGGGRPDFAQAGGKNPEQLDEALAKARELVAAQKK